MQHVVFALFSSRRVSDKENSLRIKSFGMEKHRCTCMKFSINIFVTHTVCLSSRISCTHLFSICVYFSFFPHFTHQTQHMLLSFSWPVLTRAPTLGSIWFTRRGFAPNCGALSLTAGCPESDESWAPFLLLMTEVGVLCR